MDKRGLNKLSAKRNRCMINEDMILWNFRDKLITREYSLHLKEKKPRIEEEHPQAKLEEARER